MKAWCSAAAMAAFLCAGHALATPRDRDPMGTGCRWMPVAQIKDEFTRGGAKWTPLSREQWQFMRGVFFMLPGPSVLPDGDGGVLASMDGVTMMFWVDGPRACPFSSSPLASAIVDTLASIAAGKVVHAHGLGM